MFNQNCPISIISFTGLPFWPFQVMLYQAGPHIGSFCSFWTFWAFLSQKAKLTQNVTVSGSKMLEMAKMLGLPIFPIMLETFLGHSVFRVSNTGEEENE